MAGQFDNITYKDCTSNPNYCDEITPGFPCYTCDWTLCNPNVRRPYRGGAGSDMITRRRLFNWKNYLPGIIILFTTKPFTSVLFN